MAQITKRSQRIWTLGTVIFLLVSFIVGIVAQSNYRNRQKSELVSQIYSTQSQGYDPLALATAIIQNKDQIDYVSKHKAILNIQLSSIPADASPSIDKEQWCDSLQDIYDKSDIVASEYGWSATDLQSATTSVLIASDCEL